MQVFEVTPTLPVVDGLVDFLVAVKSSGNDGFDFFADFFEFAV